MQRQPDLYHKDFVSHVRWYINIRWIYLAALAVAGIGGQLGALGWYTHLLSDVIFILTGVLVNAGFYILAKKNTGGTRYFECLALIQVLTDIALATYAIYFYGGLESKLLLLYTIPLFCAGALIGRKALLIALITIFISYDTILIFDSQGLISTNEYRISSNVALAIIFYNTMFILISFIALRSLEITTGRLRRQYMEQLALNTAKDEFVSLASHQLRTPATAVKQYLGMLQDGYAGPVPARQMKFIRKAYYANERQIRIVADILNLSHIETGTIKIHRSEQHIGSLLERIVKEQAFRAAERRQYIELKRPVGDIVAPVDPERLTMVMNYLIDNALKYSADGSKVQVRLRKLKGSYIITVKDWGVGIAKKDISKLYKKFSRIPNQYSDSGGTGLGLYVSKNIIELHGGKITVESEAGEGTSFIIRLPLK